MHCTQSSLLPDQPDPAQLRAAKSLLGALPVPLARFIATCLPGLKVHVGIATWKHPKHPLDLDISLTKDTGSPVYQPIQGYIDLLRETEQMILDRVGLPATELPHMPLARAFELPCPSASAHDRLRARDALSRHGLDPDRLALLLDPFKTR